GRAHEWRDAEEGAARGGDHLPAFLAAEEDRPPVSEHRGRAREYPAAVPDHNGRRERRREALRRVEERRREPQLRPVDAPDVGRPDVAASFRTDVLDPGAPDATRT